MYNIIIVGMMYNISIIEINWCVKHLNFWYKDNARDTN